VSRHFEKGETIFHQGAEPQGIYILLSGTATLEYMNNHPSDDTRIKRFLRRGSADASKPTSTTATISNTDKPEATCEYFTLQEGSMIGETALLQGRKHRAATVRCNEPSQVLFIHKDDFLGAMARSPALHAALFGVVRAQQARRIYDLVESLNPPSLTIKRFNTGDEIFHQSDPARYMYLIRKGKGMYLCIYIPSPKC
jgi:CRP-like cAMP-binding protein